MKRIFCFLLIGIIVLSMSACVQEEPEYIDPVAFYYLRLQDSEALHHGSHDSVIVTETREAYGYRMDLTYMLRQYLAGTAAEDLRSPFPTGTTLIDWKLSGTILSLTLSDQFATLTGMDLTLACACLTMTCTELTEAETVLISAESAMLDGKASISMNRSAMILTDESHKDTDNTEP